MKVITVAVVGVGRWGPHLVRNLLKVPGVEILAICDASPRKLRTVSRSFPSVPATTDYTKILTDQRLDCITIATPVSTHFRLASQALSAKKHVFVEKTITQTSREAKKLIERARKKKKVLMVGHTFLYSTPTRIIKQIIEKQTLGETIVFESHRTNDSYVPSDANVLWDLASHDVSLLYYIFEKAPIGIQALSSHKDSHGDQLVHLLLRYPGKMTAHILVHWPAPRKTRVISIAGRNGILVYDGMTADEEISISYRDGKTVRMPTTIRNEPLYEELAHFIECVRHQKAPLTDGNHGLRVVTVLEAATKALKQKREVALHP